MECYVCKIKFKSVKLLETHLNTHNKHERYEKCAICRDAIEETKMDQHLCGKKEDHIICGYCPQKFNSTKHLLEHLKSHDDNIKIYKCSECPQSFIMQALLLYHRRYHEKHPKSSMSSKYPKVIDISKNKRMNEIFHSKTGKLTLMCFGFDLI